MTKESQAEKNKGAAGTPEETDARPACK